MPHLRTRFAISILTQLSKLWPVVGLLGPRQSGKTTLIQSFLSLASVVSFDDLESREEANRSPKVFLSKQGFPTVLDEVQKAPEIFDAIKLRVDKKRIPGSYYLTGSSSFSSKLGIRESLTGRIGLVELLPMTLAELRQKPFRGLSQLSVPLPSGVGLRFESGEAAQSAQSGGMPIPAFLRESEQREFYWRSWLETTLLRDLSRFFKRGYDSDFAYSLLNRIGALLREGELPTLKHFSQPTRKVRTYLSAMQEIFLVRKISCHPDGIGKEVWILMDSGLAAYLMGKATGEGSSLSLIRHFLWNEWISQAEYQGRRPERIYYKSAQGSPVDAVFDGVPFRVVASTSAISRQLKWEERPLLGAMKKLDSKVGYLIAPVDSVTLPPKKGGIGILPWSAWS